MSKLPTIEERIHRTDQKLLTLVRKYQVNPTIPFIIYELFERRNYKNLMAMGKHYHHETIDAIEKDAILKTDRYLRMQKHRKQYNIIDEQSCRLIK